MGQRVLVVGPGALPVVLPAEQPGLHVLAGLEPIGVVNRPAVIADHLDRLLNKEPLAHPVQCGGDALAVLNADEVVLRLLARNRQECQPSVRDRPLEDEVQMVGEALGDSTRRLYGSTTTVQRLPPSSDFCTVPSSVAA